MIYCGHYVISLNRKVAMWVNAALAYWGCWAVSGLLDPGLPASVAARPGYYQSFCLFSNTERCCRLALARPGYYSSFRLFPNTGTVATARRSLAALAPNSQLLRAQRGGSHMAVIVA